MYVPYLSSFQIICMWYIVIKTFHYWISFVPPEIYWVVVGFIISSNIRDEQIRKLHESLGFFVLWKLFDYIELTVEYYTSCWCSDNTCYLRQFSSICVVRTFPFSGISFSILIKYIKKQKGRPLPEISKQSIYKIYKKKNSGSIWQFLFW